MPRLKKFSTNFKTNAPETIACIFIPRRIALIRIQSITSQRHFQYSEVQIASNISI